VSEPRVQWIDGAGITQIVVQLPTLTACGAESVRVDSAPEIRWLPIVETSVAGVRARVAWDAAGGVLYVVRGTQAPEPALEALARWWSTQTRRRA
jgi:hypothetical protein